MMETRLEIRGTIIRTDPELGRTVTVVGCCVCVCVCDSFHYETLVCPVSPSAWQHPAGVLTRKLVTRCNDITRAKNQGKICTMEWMDVIRIEDR